ncbi:MAG TPA: hypothetical protein VMF32_00360 [Xanthobacteraceae bacterium]|nr:hypothetical protein [Xanthobacteraceae bacterium]
MLAPAWARLRIGPYLRSEPEKRNYTGFFTASHHLHGLPSRLALLLGRHFDETDPESEWLNGDTVRPAIIHVVGERGYFTPLLLERDFVKERLWTMTRAELRHVGAEYGKSFVAMHIRRGDLTRQGIPLDRLPEVRQYTATSWFSSMVSAVQRQRELEAMPVIVFTDGSAEEVSEVLRMNGVYLRTRNPAIADLWALAHADLLFASGYSTFSMWASFLGGMPTIYAPGKIMQSIRASPPDATEIELAEGEDLPMKISHMIARHQGSPKGLYAQ